MFLAQLILALVLVHLGHPYIAVALMSVRIGLTETVKK
jgi:hypothetical protein